MIKLNLKMLSNFLFMAVILIGLAGCSGSSIVINTSGNLNTTTPVIKGTITEFSTAPQGTIDLIISSGEGSFPASFSVSGTTWSYTVPKGALSSDTSYSIQANYTPSNVFNGSSSAIPKIICVVPSNGTTCSKGIVLNDRNHRSGPGFAVTYPGYNQIALTNTPNITGTAPNEAVTVKVQIDGGALVTASLAANNWNYTTPVLMTGSHTVTANAYDISSNLLASITVPFCVQTAVLDSSFATSGILTSVLGTGYSIYTSDTDFYIAGQDIAMNGYLQKFDSSGNLLQILNAADMSMIKALVVHPSGSVIAAGQDKSTGNFAFSIYSPDGTSHTQYLPTGATGTANSLATDQDGNILIGGIGSTFSGLIFKYDINGNLLASANSLKVATAGTNIAIDQNNNINFAVSFSGFQVNVVQYDQNLVLTATPVLTVSTNNAAQIETLSNGNLLLTTDASSVPVLSVYDTSYAPQGTPFSFGVSANLRSVIIYPQISNFSQGNDIAFMLYDDMLGNFGIAQFTIDNMNNVDPFYGFYFGTSGTPSFNNESITGDPQALSFDLNGNVYALGSSNAFGGNIQVAKYLNCHSFTPVSYSSGPQVSFPNNGFASFPSNIYVYANGTQEVTTTTLSSGQFSYTMPALTSAANINIDTVSVYNSGKINISRQDVITVQGAPTIINPPSSSSNLTIEGPPSIAGNAPQSSLVEIKFGCCTLGFATADPVTGIWKLDTAPLAGTNKVSSTVLYNNGSVSNPSADLMVATAVSFNQPTPSPVPYDGVKSKIEPILPVKFVSSVSSINTLASPSPKSFRAPAVPEAVSYSVGFNAAAQTAGYVATMLPATRTVVGSDGVAAQPLPPVVFSFPVSIVVTDSNGFVIDNATQNITVEMATPTPVSCQSGLLFTKTVDNANSCPGSAINYTVNITNNLTGAISPVVTDILSPLLTGIVPTSADGSVTLQNNSNAVTWSIMDLNPTQSAMLKIAANVGLAVPGGTVITNQAQVTNGDTAQGAIPIDCGTDPVTTTVRSNCQNRALYSVRFNQPFCNPVSALVFSSKSPISPQMPPIVKQASSCGVLIEADKGSTVEFLVMPTT